MINVVKNICEGELMNYKHLDRNFWRFLATSTDKYIVKYDLLRNNYWWLLSLFR